MTQDQEVSTRTSPRRWTRWLRRLVLYPVLGLLVVVIGLFAFVMATRYPQGPPHDTPLVLTGATVLVGPDLEPQDDTTVIVVEGVIEAVGAADDIDVPSDAEVVDLDGTTLLPGLIDSHVHLSTPELEPGESYGGFGTLVRSVVDGARHAPHQRRAFIDHGVTTVRSLGDDRTWILEVRDMVADGELEGPRVLAVGPVFTARGGHPVVTLHGGEVLEGGTEVPETPDEARSAVRSLAADGGVDWIKVIHDRGAEARPGPFPLDPIASDVLEAIVDEAGANGLPVVAHWGTVDDLDELLAVGVDAVEHLEVRDEMVDGWPEGYPDAIVEAGVPIGPTLAVVDASGRTPENIAQGLERFAELHAAGATVVASSDAPMNGLRFGAGLHRELELLVEAGMTPAESLRAATSTAAEVLRNDDIGAIEPGRAADLLAVGGDPLADITAISEVVAVWRDGRLVVDQRP